MGYFKHFFLLLPTGYKLSLITGTFILITICILLLSTMGLTILSNIRAYTTGEGLWSKGQKDAVYFLVRYAHTRDEENYQRFMQAIAVPLGDHQARMELEKPNPDLDVVYEGFIQGGNHANDVAGMARLYRYLHWERHMREAIDTWAAGDMLILELLEISETLQAEIQSGEPDEALIGDLLGEIDRINVELRPLEDRFSQVLGEGARWMYWLLLLVITTVAVLLLTLGSLLSWWLLYHIRAAEEKYRHLFETANNAILLADAQTGIILDANQRAEELWGMSRLSLLGLHQKELHPDKETEMYQGRFAQATRGEPLEMADMYIKRADDLLVPVVISASLTELKGRAVVQGIFHDISERKRMEESVRRSQKLQSLGIMAGGLAHDFNNLLSSILVQNELALRRLAAGQPAAAHIEKALATAQQAADLTGKMLAYSGQGHFQLQPVSLNQVMVDNQNLLATAAAQRATLDLQLPSNLPLIEADLNQLNQLLLSLILNSAEAIEETGRQGTIRITTAAYQLGASKSVATATGEPLPPGPYVQVTIADDGVGMDEETAAHIFDPFYSTKFTGRGLGLPVVLGIVRGHNGGIQVTSSPGAGTTIDVYFPVMTPTQ